MKTTERQTPALEFEKAYRDHRVALIRLAFLLSGSEETSEDAVQSAFASAHERWDEIREPLPYLKRTVVNLVKDGQRRNFRLLARTPERTSVVLPPEVDETWGHLSRLSSAQRTVVVLHYYEDLTLTEVGATARPPDRPTATIRSDHRRALDKLRKALA